MRDKARIHEILHDLETIWNIVPDYRFFQLLNAIGFDSHMDWFYVEDDKLKAVLKEVIDNVDNGGDTH